MHKNIRLIAHILWLPRVAVAFASLLTATIGMPCLAEEVRVEKDVAYLGPERAEKADLYLPEMLEPGKKYPGVVIIHGGGWTGGDKAAAREINIGTTLAAQGYYPEHVGVDCFKCRIREGLAGPQEPALLGHRSAVGGLVVAGRMPERSQHRVSGGLDGRSERPAMGSGQPRTAANS